MRLSTCLIQFFSQYLPRIKGVSKRTIEAYHCTFTLFLPFAAQYFSIKIQSLRVYHLSPGVIFAFLDYLENQRNNIASTRNHRLAAIKSLSRMIRLVHPEKRDLVERILNIPEKKVQKQLIGFLYPDEIRNRLGHQSISSTMVYLHLDLSRSREIQKKMYEYTQSILPQDPKIEELIDWENKDKILAWLDSLK